MPRLEKRIYKISTLLQQSDIPALSLERQPSGIKADIDDFEGLFINYGKRDTAYPYTMQSLYEDETEREITVAVLENEYLYAEFLPSLGGRLWKLCDKTRKKDIIYTNDVIRFRNLSIRNAWFSGGVEWNCGIIGHSPFTCSDMYCAFVRGKNAEEVLRFYEFERVRGIYYQIDFWLEKNKLMTAVRIENQNEEVTPMYWWSNTATPEYRGGRVAVPAISAFNNSDGVGIKKSQIPFDRGADVSYPENIPETIDYFYDIKDGEDRFFANVGADGYGLLQFSSSNLKGRKLFSWGHKKGSAHWQSLLTNSAGDYVELQAGLGKTQYECIPMPPKCAWNFMECYALAEIPPELVSAGYGEFTQAVRKQMQALGGCCMLDKRLESVSRDISLQKGRVMLRGSGFGYLNKALGGKAPKQLEFFPDAEIKPWLRLVDGQLPGRIKSFAFGEKMKALLLKNADMCCWSITYQLALLAYDKRHFRQAEKYCRQSMVLDNNVYNRCLMAHILYQLGDERAAYFAEECLRRGCGNYYLAESIMRLLLQLRAYDKAAEAFSRLSGGLRSNPRLLMYYAKALLETGNPEKAWDILTENGGITLLDYREGDRFLDRLYRGVRKALFNERFDEVAVPQQYDFVVSDHKTEEI